MAIRKEILDELLKNYKNPEDLFGEGGLLKELKKALIEKVLEGELTHHLGYPKHDSSGRGTGNSRNGKSSKTVKTGDGNLEIGAARDRNGSFEPQLIKKGQTRFEGFDQKILDVRARDDNA